jgi:hypothetical protein
VQIEPFYATFAPSGALFVSDACGVVQVFC